MEYLNSAFDLFVFIAICSAAWQLGALAIRMAVKWVMGE